MSARIYSLSLDPKTNQPKLRFKSDAAGSYGQAVLKIISKK